MSHLMFLIRMKPICMLVALMLCAWHANAASQDRSPSIITDNLAYSQGEVLSIQKGGGYTIVQVRLANSETVFLAFTQPVVDVEVGNQISWDTARLAVDYHSRALQRTFSTLYMATFKQIGIEHGVIESIQTIGTNAYVLVKGQQTKSLLLVDNQQIHSELKPGAQVEWQPAKVQPFASTSINPIDSPVTVEWLRTSHGNK